MVDQLPCLEILVLKLKVFMNRAKLATLKLKFSTDLLTFFTKSTSTVKNEVGKVLRISIQFSSVAQSCLTFCNPMDCSTPGFPVHHQLPDLAQTHVHWVGDAIQPSHPLLSPSPPAFSSSWCLPASRSFPMSQFFTSGAQSIGVSASASILPMNIQDWFPLGWTGWISLYSKGLSRVFSNTTVQ